MIEMGVMPQQWRAASREDREYLLAIRRHQRGIEAVEYAESQAKAKPQVSSHAGTGGEV